MSITLHRKRTSKNRQAPSPQFDLPFISHHQIGCDSSDTKINIPANGIIREKSMVLPLADLLSLAAICKTNDVKRVFEIGTYTGATTRVLALNSNPACEIFTLDLDPNNMPAVFLDGNGKPIYQAGISFKGTPEAAQIRQLFGRSEEFDFSPYFGTMDLVFVDADHSYEAVLKDSQIALKLIRPGGIIVWDDYRWLPEHHSCQGVTRALHEMSEAYPIFQIKGTRLAIYRDQDKSPRSKRILVVSNFYPPNDIGGYELGCADVVEGLKAKGHDVKVLTSFAGTPTLETDKGIYRWLDVRMNSPKGMRYFTTVLKSERRNQRRFKTLLDEFNPELVYYWNMGNGCSSLLYADADRPMKRACFVSDGWHQRLLRIDRLAKTVNGSPVKKMLSPLTWALSNVLKGCGVALPKGNPKLDCIQFASNYLKDQSPPHTYGDAKVSVRHWGVATNPQTQLAPCSEPSRILFLGQVMPHKGAHTLVQAFTKLSLDPKFANLKLSMVGGTSDEAYLAKVKGLASNAREGSIEFRGKIPRDQVKQAMRDHDIFVLPSEWDEPFSISLLEAMSEGLAVVGTLRGGTKEILVNEETGLTFSDGDTASLEKALVRLVTDNDLFQKVRRNGLEAVTRKHQLREMINKLEEDLVSTIDQKC